MKLQSRVGRFPSISLQRQDDLSRRYAALAVLILLVVLNVIFTRNFWATQTMWNILLHSASTALVAIGMTLVIATGGIDLSVGSVMAIAAVVSTFFLGYGVVVIVFATVIISSVVGLFNGAIISIFKVQPIIMTLAMMIAGRGIAQVLTDGFLVPFSHAGYEFIGKGKVGSVPVPVIIMFLVTIAISYYIKNSIFGRYVEAVGDNEVAAHLSGVDIKRVKTSVYVISAALAAMAGLIVTARLAASDASRIGQFVELDAIASVVVGGTMMTGGKPYIWGTVVGVILMSVITATFNMNNIPYAYSLVLKAVIIVTAIYLQREKTS